ncbi:type II secretion system protein [Clostridium cochlearium]|uniref:type II secretion system protein n=2 Tax=Clostridium TaxID=1485 RepID=UPI001EE111CB|nr:type II secretion system protein [Clostridium cochlearium]MBV1819077.1 type II secretion system GspH family protein [Bacteroidales bacterium MSK.15.36]MCG4571912.1 type II secretion system GspH family protein [Clostridium cochlearium]MCG4580652.1 type II secretion system GspH family protein [Clostridium cochlearium]
MKSTKKKAFTLIEVIITMAIMVIVIGIIFPFFNSNFKTLNETEIRGDLQREGNKVMEYFTKSAMEANNVKETKDTIVFSTDDNEEYLFQLKHGNIIYSDSTKKNIKIAENVDNIEVTAPYPNSINIKIEFIKSKVNYVTESNIYFRNN